MGYWDPLHHPWGQIPKVRNSVPDSINERGEPSLPECWELFGRDDSAVAESHVEAISPQPNTAPRLSRKAIPELPMPSTFKRQQSELQDRLELSGSIPNETTVFSVDRRSNDLINRFGDLGYDPNSVMTTQAADNGCLAGDNPGQLQNISNVAYKEEEDTLDKYLATKYCLDFSMDNLERRLSPFITNDADVTLGLCNDDLFPCQRFNIQDHHAPSSKPYSEYSVKQRGIKVLIGGRTESAFGDTAAGQNVISKRRVQQLGLKMRSGPKSFPMGNSKKIFSPGTVELLIAFEDDPGNMITIVAHVVEKFAYDLILGNPFLKATKCLTDFIHRFVPCLFSINSKSCFNLLGETTHRFSAQLGEAVPFIAVLDIGSARNIMDADYATNFTDDYGVNILTGPESCGWVIYPDGTEELTIGQAHTTITLPDGTVKPIVFELLPHCHVPVVLGQDFVFGSNIYKKYATSILDIDDWDTGDELMPMGFRWNRSRGKRSTAGAPIADVRIEDDLERQLAWNQEYQGGRTASIDEWNLEDTRREEHERRRNPLWLRDRSKPLIAYKPGPSSQGRDSDHSIRSPSQSDDPAAMSSGRDESSHTSISSNSAGSTLKPSSDSSSSNAPNHRPNPWDGLNNDSFGDEEADQWGAELLNYGSYCRI